MPIIGHQKENQLYPENAPIAAITKPIMAIRKYPIEPRVNATKEIPAATERPMPPILHFCSCINGWSARYVKLDVNIKGENETPTIESERVPNKEELARILRKATGRGRVAIALLAFAGLRPESLGDYEGKDGLRIGDIKEWTIKR